MAHSTAASSAHPPHEAHAEHHGSFWPLILTIGVTLFLLGAMKHVLVLPGFLIMVASVYGWVREDVIELRGKPYQDGHSDYWLGTIVLILSEIIIFGVLFSFYFWSRSHQGAEFVPEQIIALTGGSATQGPNIIDALGHAKMLQIWLNTAFLLTSGVTAEFAMHFLKKGNNKNFRVWLGITVLLGALFVAGQVREYVNLVDEGLTPVASVYGTSFFSLTGVHGIHVLAGVVILASILILSFTGFVTKERASGVHGAFLYWHFVDAIWIIVVSVIYLRLV